ncbi:MAG: hypothetical protein QOG77_583, partial [Solirubrobacteraceae bacterium]|nr:hypothetical protein [Solirubrobacteraceae bacterium]
MCPICVNQTVELAEDRGRPTRPRRLGHRPLPSALAEQFGK